jgi:hypothetical protein
MLSAMKARAQHKWKSLEEYHFYILSFLFVGAFLAHDYVSEPFRRVFPVRCVCPPLNHPWGFLAVLLGFVWVDG